VKARTTMSRNDSELGSWQMARRAPHPALAAAVHRYIGYVERSTAPVRRREVPQEQVTMIINFGPPMTISGPRLAAAGRGSFVAPVNESYAITEFAGISHGIQVDLSPFAARALLGRSMRELDAVVVDLEDLLGADGRRLVERLYEAPDWDARFDLLDRTIGRRLEETVPPSPDVARAWRRLRETDGRLEIGELAAELRCSRRHLVSRFREHVGPPPKAVARIMRFRRVLRLLERDGARLAEVAQDCGYYDQAHLNRDFRELAGTSPGGYAGSRLPDGVGVLA
jgi:AraC-like DNA-binding protein